jgi:hypothetical protein
MMMIAFGGQKNRKFMGVPPLPQKRLKLMIRRCLEAKYSKEGT